MNLNDACYRIFADASMAGKALRQKQMQCVSMRPEISRDNPKNLTPNNFENIKIKNRKRKTKDNNNNNNNNAQREAICSELAEFQALF